MRGELRYEISQNADIKLVLHALKHKTSGVNGVLIGRVSPQNDGVVEITDSVPLFHSHLGLLPQLEISLILIEEYYASKGVNIVGYFHANERFDDYELGGVAKNIGDHVSRYFPQVAILLLDNRKLTALEKTKDWSPVMQVGNGVLSSEIFPHGCQVFNIFPEISHILIQQLFVLCFPLKPVLYKGRIKNWKLVGLDAGYHLTTKEPLGNVVLLDYISTEKWQDLVDFDDHLDDISKDWLSPELFK